MKSINLLKGERINLTKSVINLSKDKGILNCTVGLRWDSTEGKSSNKNNKKKKNIGSIFLMPAKTSDLDADTWIMAYSKSSDNLSYPNVVIVSYGNLRWNTDEKVSQTIIEHMGDNIKGGKDGDCEQIKINFDLIPKDYTRIIVGVTLYAAEIRNQSLEDLTHAYIRVIDNNTNNEICRHNFEDITISSKETHYSFIAGAFDRLGSTWQFTALAILSKRASIESVCKAVIDREIEVR